MRITESMMASRALADMQRASSAAAKTSYQVSTGNRLERPSDDPHAAERAVRLRADLAATKQYRATVEHSLGWAQATDDALGNISDVVQRAREILVQGGNDSLSTGDRSDLAKQIDHLIAQAKASGNATYDGQFIFAGQVTNTPPYTPDGADTYAGDNGAIVRTIGPGVSVRLNATGGTVLGDGTDGKVLDVLRDIAAHLRSTTAADHNALRTTDLAALDANMDALGQARAEAGALTNRLTAAGSRLHDVETSTENVRSTVEHVDMAEALARLSQEQAVYQAALKATAMNLDQRTLMDFLG
jgi:flagellar hook-associated protein 3 FlgL